MGKMENPGIWDKIQRNVQETERLMGQKKYNLSMIKARQTLEYMVKLQCDKAGIVESTTDTMIRELYDGKWISKSTAEHYLQILAIGNKASKEGDNSAYNANQAYHVLSQEIYSFTDVDKAPRARRSSSSKQPSVRSRKKQDKSVINSVDLLKLLIPIVLVIVLIFLIRILAPKKTPTNETTLAISTEAPTTEAPSTEATVPEVTEPAPTVTYKTTTTLNVRKEASTDSDRIGKLDPDQTVDYVADENDDWAIIMYNGQQAYVAKQYLTPVE